MLEERILEVAGRRREELAPFERLVEIDAPTGEPRVGAHRLHRQVRRIHIGVHVEAPEDIEPAREERGDLGIGEIAAKHLLERAQSDEELAGVTAGTADDAAVVAAVDARDEAAHEERGELDPLHREAVADVLLHVLGGDVLRRGHEALVDLAEHVPAVEDRSIARGGIAEIAPRHDAAGHVGDEAHPQLGELIRRVVGALLSTGDEDHRIVGVDARGERLDPIERDPIRAGHVAEHAHELVRVAHVDDPDPPPLFRREVGGDERDAARRLLEVRHPVHAEHPLGL